MNPAEANLFSESQSAAARSVAGLEPPAEKAPAQHADLADRLHAHYELQGRILGVGGHASVQQAVCRRTGRRVAVKTYRTSRMSKAQLQAVRSELEVHMSLKHLAIVNAEAAYETGEFAHLVMEELRGGDVFDHLVECGRFSETDAAQVIVQVLSALAYMQSEGVAHRDVKLENMMYTDSDRCRIKIVDLGFAAKIDPRKGLQGRCGTLQYIAPEVLSGRSYNERVDIWSTGSVLYALLTGRALFSGDENEVAMKTRWGHVKYCRRFRALPKDAQDFVRSLLAKDPADRPSAWEALRHPWLRRVAPQEAAAAERKEHRLPSAATKMQDAGKSPTLGARVERWLLASALPTKDILSDVTWWTSVAVAPAFGQMLV